MLGLMGASALLYSVNTWLPELMRRNGFGQTASLAFRMFNNGATTPVKKQPLCCSRCEFLSSFASLDRPIAGLATSGTRR
jgi:hypothetical protein